MRVIADSTEVGRLIGNLARSIAAEVQRNGGAAPWALVGVRSRGDVLAQRLRGHLAGQVGADRVGSLDITLYRDDLSEIGPRAVVGATEIPFSVDGLNIVLLDDVLMTGRSVRAALQELMDLGRPRRVWLGVLVDRGGRELPITADFVGLDLASARSPRFPLAPGELVEVKLQPTDDQDQIIIRPAPDPVPAAGKGNQA